MENRQTTQTSPSHNFSSHFYLSRLNKEDSTDNLLISDQLGRFDHVGQSQSLVFHL